MIEIDILHIALTAALFISTTVGIRLGEWGERRKTQHISYDEWVAYRDKHK